ncbi:MAG: hypothetical protein COA47_03875 [Robiginitomaculum sp.]|nr:MAG: hypothetical protein COA47_03875 [Robiginitomaculum sp.]
MKNHFVLAATLGLLIVLPTDGFAQTSDCDSALSFAEMMSCAQNDYKTADGALNIAYRKNQETLNTKGKTLLRDAQRAWIKFRNAECKWEADTVRGGRDAELTKLACLADLTMKRTKTLNEEANAAQASADPLANQDDHGAELLDYRSYGPIRFGQTVASIEVELGEKITLTEYGAEDMTQCYMARFPRYPNALLMVEKGIVTRAEVDASVGNTLGVSVGDSFASVQAKFPNAEIELQKYVMNAHEITIHSSPAGFSILLLEEAGKITQIRAGTAESVQYVEHCL